VEASTSNSSNENSLPDSDNPWNNNFRSPSPTGSDQSDRTVIGRKNNNDSMRLKILDAITRR
jgi:hypothetical protein